jgi:hypothetical protein
MTFGAALPVVRRIEWAVLASLRLGSGAAHSHQSPAPDYGNHAINPKR